MLRATIALALLLSACARSATPTSATGGDQHPWPMFRGSADHRGDASHRPTPAWRVRWSYELGERIDASAVVANGSVAAIAGRDGSIVLLDVATGAERVRTRADGGIWSSPAVVGDTLAVATDRGALLGLDLRSLQPRWRQTAPAAALSGYTVAEGDLFICSGRTLLRIDPESGDTRWSADLGAPSFTAPAISGTAGVAVVGNRNGDVLAFSVDSGAPVWRAQTSPGADNDGTPTLTSTLALIGSNDRHLHAFDLSSGEPRWSRRGEHWVVSSPAVVGDSAFYGDDGGVIRRVDLGDGAVRWQARAGDDVASSPTVVGAVVVHGAHDSRVHAHDTETGESLPAIDVGHPVFASPAVAEDGTILLATHGGRIVAIR